jgi:predicted O-methyltransferase YrrM
MSETTWNAVDALFVDALVGTDEVLDAALAASAAAGLPDINVAPNQGKLLHLLARSVGAERILEVGTLGGYSTIWLARALPPQGHLVTLELDPHHAEVATANVARAGLAAVTEVRVGPALDSLRLLVGEGTESFDFVFIDADKPNNTGYVQAALELSHPGTLIVVDNVGRNGAVADPDNDDASVLGVRRLLDYLAAEPRVQATAVQTVGSKGYDGFLVGLVVS